MSKITYYSIFFFFLLISGCGFNSSSDDLTSYIEQVKQRPSGTIDELPTFTVYEPFVYGAAGDRSPFDEPVLVEQRIIAKANSNVKPDNTRVKEYLEGFSLSKLEMVGTLTWKNALWALVSDDSGEIHRVKNGNYLGLNHGKIMATDETKIELIEIVSNGLKGWVERPRILALSEKED